MLWFLSLKVYKPAVGLGQLGLSIQAADAANLQVVKSLTRPGLG